MSKRPMTGGALTLIIACTITIVLIGICFFFAVQIFGAVRSAQNATDSGNLGLVKQALRRPSIRDRVTDTARYNALKTLGDQGVGNEVNLATYNRLVGAAFIAVQNARVENTDLAYSNAEKLVQEVNRVAVRLRDALRTGNAASDTDISYNLKNEFKTLTDAHTVRMAGNNSQIVRTNYEVGYYTDTIPATNLLSDRLPASYNLDNNSNQALPDNAVIKGADGKNYVRGYQPLTFNFAGRSALTMFGVPVHPSQAPHLISKKNFSSTAPSGGDHLPPNAFFDSAMLTQNGKADQAGLQSVATIGIVDTNQTFVPRMRRGYLIIDNRGVGDGAGYSPTGSSVLANELGTGIHGFGAYPNAVFSTNLAALNAWTNYDHSGNPPETAPADLPSTAELFNAEGNPASWQECWKMIPKNGDAWECTDLNTASHPCNNLIDKQPGRKQGSFDLAYHRDNDLNGETGAGGSLMAVEIAKCRVWQAYYVPPFSACVNNVCAGYFDNIPSTGIRRFPDGRVIYNGQSAPYGRPNEGFKQVTGPATGQSYSQPTTCQVTTNGNLNDILAQTFPANQSFMYAKGGNALTTMNAPGSPVADAEKPANKIRAFIANRLRQIKPPMSDADETVITNKVNQIMSMPVAMGELYYVHVDPDANNANNDNLVMDQVKPDDFNENVVPDGTVRRYVRRYDLREVIANTQFDNNIHDHHFMSQIPPNTLFGFNTVSILPGTGADNGCLGVIKLQNDAGCIQSPGYTSGVLGADPHKLNEGPATANFNLCNRD